MHRLCRVEATGLSDLNAAISVFIGGKNVTASLGVPEVTTNNDNVAASLDKAWTFRSLTLPKEGVVALSVTVQDAIGTGPR